MTLTPKQLQLRKEKRRKKRANRKAVVKRPRTVQVVENNPRNFNTKVWKPDNTVSNGPARRVLKKTETFDKSAWAAPDQ